MTRFRFGCFDTSMTPPIATQKPDALIPGRDARVSAGWIWAFFLASATVCIGLFFVPAFVIRPFRYQSPHALSLAISLRQHAPLGATIAVLLCFILAVILWKTVGRWQKALLVMALVPVIFSAVMARLNYFEWMFHPIDGAKFLAQSDSKLDSKEMIMAVNLGGDARAYPISQMAYHHVLNDVVGGVPVTVTY
jgi:hypothetical protein